MPWPNPQLTLYYVGLEFNLGTGTLFTLLAAVSHPSCTPSIALHRLRFTSDRWWASSAGAALIRFCCGLFTGVKDVAGGGKWTWPFGTGSVLTAPPPIVVGFAWEATLAGVAIGFALAPGRQHKDWAWLSYIQSSFFFEKKHWTHPAVSIKLLGWANFKPKRFSSEASASVVLKESNDDDDFERSLVPAYFNTCCCISSSFPSETCVSTLHAVKQQLVLAVIWPL